MWLHRKDERRNIYFQNISLLYNTQSRPYTLREEIPKRSSTFGYNHLVYALWRIKCSTKKESSIRNSIRIRFLRNKLEFELDSNSFFGNDIFKDPY